MGIDGPGIMSSAVRLTVSLARLVAAEVTADIHALRAIEPIGVLSPVVESTMPVLVAIPTPTLVVCP